MRRSFGDLEHRSRWRAPYTASVTFYRADGSTPVACPLTTADAPAYVKVVSTGTAEGEAARTIETYAQLTPVYSGFGAAIMAVNGTIVRQQLRGERSERQRR